MENPYPLPPVLREQWNDLIAGIEINRYPDPQAGAVKKHLAEALELDPAVRIILGNGSDELIHMLYLAIAQGSSARVICPEPSFAVYRIAAQALGLEFIGVPLRAADFALDLPAMLETIERTQPALVMLASPNNPTGNRLVDGSLEALCRQAPGLVVLDEAYYRFAGATRVADVLAIENLVVMQTLSKIGLAGLRVGALFGAAGWIDLLERLRMPYNINVLSQAGAVFALTHAAEFDRQIAAIVTARESLYARLNRIAGIHAWPSATNFILLRTPRGRAGAVFESLREQQVLVKNVSGAHVLLADCLRVTVGTPAENALFITALERALT